MSKDGKLDDWKRANTGVVRYLMFIQKEFYNNSNFEEKRAVVHERAVRNLRQHLEKLQSALQAVQANLDTLVNREIPDMPYPATDSKDVIMKLRVLTVVERRLLKHQIQWESKKFGAIRDWIKDVKAILDLFTQGLVPESMMCHVFPELFDNEGRFAACEVHARKFKCYACLKNRKKAELQKENKALWACDFPRFMKNLVQEAKERFLPDLSYLEPFEGEVSLSRCLFGYKSKYVEDLDQVVDSILDGDGEGFVEKVVAKCYWLMTFREVMDISEQSLALLLFFRCIFNRCYEKFPHFFAPKTLEDVNQLCAVPDFQARQFLLPKEMLAVEITDQSISSIFRDDEYYRRASQYIESSIFMCNPVDALFCIHKCLIEIHTAAMHNRKDLDEEGVDPSKQLLCFDDLFALFFGCLMGTGPPTTDVFYLSWLIGQFAPKESLSPSFEYAEANLEALAMHCKKINIGTLQSGGVVATDV